MARTRRFFLIGVWLALGLTGILLWIGPGGTGLTAAELRNRIGAWALLWMAGWILQVHGLRRDPRCDMLAELARSRVAAAGAIVSILIIQLSATVASGVEIVLIAMTLGNLLLTVWAFSSTPNAVRERVGRLTLLLGSLMVLGIVAEMIVRLPWIVERTGGTLEEKRDHWKEKLDFDAVTANPWGVRSLHVELDKPSSVFRIVTLGDSFTAGDWVPNTADIWPYVMERQLRDRGYPVQVVNLGRGGTTTENQLDSFERIGWWFDPDLVILQYNINDAFPADRSATEVFRTYPLIPLLDRRLLEKSYLYAVLATEFRRLQFSLFYPKGYLPLFAEDASGWIQSRDALQKLVQQCKERQVPTFIVLFPLFEGSPLHEGYRYLPVHEKIETTMKDLDVPFLDLRDSFARINPEARHWWVLPWDSHPGIMAHELAGVAIARDLQIRELVQKNQTVP